jgi:23S rRNA pseudouridine1911/1915/1917 synthase
VKTTGYGFDILYDSAASLVVSKPPGVLTQAVPGVDCLEVRIRAYTGMEVRPPEVYVGTVHRLDRPATGAILFGKTLKATRQLGAQFENRRVQKVYWACVEGQLQGSGTWTDYVRKIPGIPQAEIVAEDHPEGRIAVLHYRVLGTGSWGSWLEIELETGRTHQIRIQAASRAHPVLGDAQYGSAIAFGPQYDDVRLRPIALHARSLTFYDPAIREVVTAVAPVGEPWQKLGMPS